MKFLYSPKLAINLRFVFTRPGVFCVHNRALVVPWIPLMSETLSLGDGSRASGGKHGEENSLRRQSGCAGTSVGSVGRDDQEENEQHRLNSKGGGKGSNTGDGFDRGAFARLLKSERKYPNAEVRNARMMKKKKKKVEHQQEHPVFKMKMEEEGCSNAGVRQDHKAKRKVGKSCVQVKQGGKGQGRYIHGLEGQVSELGHGSGCFIGYWKGAVKGWEGKNIMEALIREVEWMDKEVVVFGKKHMQPRRIAYMADGEDLSYTYSKLTLVPKPYSPTVQMIKEQLERLQVGSEPMSFNCVLLNYYRDGSDHIGWHADDEPLFGDNPTIGSVSFGVERDFILRSMTDSMVKYLYKLGEGDVLVMSGATQKCFKHCIPKRSTVSGGRINLTFRKIVKKETEPLPI